MAEEVSCQFQEYEEKVGGGRMPRPKCKVTNGECQFVQCQECCSIRAAFSEVP